MTAQPLVLNRRSRAKAATQAKMVEAAAFLFANTGYFAVGVRDIAKRMGMSTGAVFANVTSKEQLWTLAVGGRAPDPALAEEVALLEAQRPGWRWSLHFTRKIYVASLWGDGNPLLDHDTHHASGKGDTPAEALRQARIQADRIFPREPTS